MTSIAQAALEFWRASGERSKERLRALVEHYASVNGEAAYANHHYEQAVSAVRDYEWR